MLRTSFAALGLTLLAIPVLADDIDPEPPPKGAIVKSGDLVITATKGGDIVARDKNQKVAWQVRLGKGKSDKPPQLGVGGERVIHARDDTVLALDLKTGKTVWTSTGQYYRDAKMTVNGGSITLSRNDVTVEVDVQTGRMMSRGGKDKKR